MQRTDSNYQPGQANQAGEPTQAGTQAPFPSRIITRNDAAEFIRAHRMQGGTNGTISQLGERWLVNAQLYLMRAADQELRKES